MEAWLARHGEMELLASHVSVHVADEPLATPCVTQWCVVDNGASCVNSGSVAAEHEGSHRKERKDNEVLKSAVLKGPGLASGEREPVVAACGDAEYSESVAERPVALQDAAARESRESDAAGVAQAASCVSGDPQMSCRENVIAMGSSYELTEETANKGTAAYVMQPQAVAGRTVAVAEGTANVSVDVAAKQPFAAYADQRCVVEHGAPSSGLAELGCSDKKGRKRQPASPQCSVAATQADEAAAVPSRARKRGGEGALLLLCDGVRRMARVFSDDDGRCIPPSKGRSL
ncbi:hypothetical protein HPB48_004729 [Haemaphysalis longicornis]|uniref:Uncharacterized protein n=1 Tax=Haemaphysalis longicornis TaxID=44386 RepID=A0A9J6FR46_HAELO|nr:hypothetical protein HPB48_004729 [Haemaphysalis longicornis]